MRRLILASLLLCACSEPTPRPEAPSLQRLLAEDPTLVLTPDTLAAATPAFEWGFGEGLALPSSTGTATWEREVRLDAAEVQRIEVELEGLRRGRLRLSWAAPGESPQAETSLSLTRREAADPAGTLYRFDLLSASGWWGEIGRLRLDVVQPPGSTAVLRAVRGLRQRLDEARLAAALEHGLKADVGSAWRNALPALPGLELEWSLEVPAGGRLRFACSSGGAEAVRFAVAAAVAADAGDDAAGEVLFERDLGAGDAAWSEHQVDLSAYAGRAVTLRFTATSPRPVDPLRHLPLWGDPAVTATPAAPPPSVVLISLDTLRADRLSLYGHRRPTSPEIDRWAERSAVVFEQAVAQAPWTLPSHVSMLTGLEAYRHGVGYDAPEAAMPPALVTLAERLQAAGYATEAVTAGGFVHPRYGFAQGFDRYRYWPADRHRDEELADGVERALEVVEGHRGRPFFLFFHSYEVHLPNAPREPWFSRFSELDGGHQVVGRPGRPEKANGFVGQPRWLLKDDAGERPIPAELAELPADLYDSAIAYTDAQVARLLARLESLEPRPIVILTSDHGESLGEAGRWSHGHLDDANLRVPLIVALSEGRGAGRRIEAQVRSIDLVPTVLDALGLEAGGGLDGVSLLPLVDGRDGGPPETAWSYAASNNRGLALRWRGRTKYVFQDSVWPPAWGDEALYDLVEDPLETVDRSALDPELAARMRARAAETLARSAAGVHLRLANATAEPLVGTLESPFFGPVAVKSPDLGCPCVRWAGQGRARIEVPAGGGYTLISSRQKEPVWRLSGRLRLAGCAEEIAFSVVSPLAEMNAPASVRLDPERCAASTPAPGEAATGLTFWWQGEAIAQEAAPPVDPALREQLEALGYVE